VKSLRKCVRCRIDARDLGADFSNRGEVGLVASISRLNGPDHEVPSFSIESPFRFDPDFEHYCSSLTIL
jgi:hypothetical protein